MALTIGDVVSRWALTQPQSVAFCFNKTEILTFEELERWSGRVATHLVEAGLVPGERVGILGNNSLEWCVAAVAIMRAGGILVPFNYRHTAYEVAGVVKDCSPHFVFVFVSQEQGSAVREVEGPAPTIISLAEVTAMKTGVDVSFDYRADPEATVVITYTSGSTAKPKGVMLSHRSLMAYAFESMLNYPAHRVGAKSYNVPPLYVGGGTIQMIHFLILGMTDFFEPDFRAERALEILSDEKVEIFVAVPTFLERMAALPAFAEADLSHMQLVATGGARVPMPLLKAYSDKGVIVRQLYGLTEAGGTTTIMSAKGAIGNPEKCGNGGIFTRHRIVTEDGSDAPVGTPGEILVQGPAVMQGYWNSPEATAATFVDGWLRTGDIGVFDVDGNITVVDRLKDIIISGGLNIWPVDIEAVIAEIESVQEVAVISAKDARFGETPMAIIYASSPLDVSAVITYCNQRLADYKVPRYVAILNEPLPRLASGKIAKPLLRERYSNASETMQRVR